jgi:hypothetical protein
VLARAAAVEDADAEALHGSRIRQKGRRQEAGGRRQEVGGKR